MIACIYATRRPDDTFNPLDLVIGTCVKDIPSWFVHWFLIQFKAGDCPNSP